MVPNSAMTTTVRLAKKLLRQWMVDVDRKCNRAKGKSSTPFEQLLVIVESLTRNINKIRIELLEEDYDKFVVVVKLGEL